MSDHGPSQRELEIHADLAVSLAELKVKYPTAAIIVIVSPDRSLVCEACNVPSEQKREILKAASGTNRNYGGTIDLKRS